MISNIRNRAMLSLVIATVLLAAWPAFAQARQGKKVYMITDMEGVDGVFNWVDQCRPFQSARWAESQKLLADEVNAAVDGLYAGGATDVLVADLHDSGRSLSVLTIDPRAKLLTGDNTPPTIGLDRSYSAVIFIGQHAMAGAKNAVLAHSYSFHVQNMWINNIRVGEIGVRTMLAGYYGIPVIMLAGDQAACNELHGLVPNARCAVVKWGMSWNAGISLSHKAACALIRQKTQDAMEHLAEFKPYHVTNPVTVKIETTVQATPGYWARPGVEKPDERTQIFHGKNLLDAWLQYGDF